LRNLSGKLLKNAEAGQISLITKHGKPAILAVPFDRRLLDHIQSVPAGAKALSELRLIETVAPVLNSLSKEGYRLSSSLIAEILKIAKEM
jgi:antitoxin (DNA-binding transcriptional repressor) of toxin-antitoxin stability system